MQTPEDRSQYKRSMAQIILEQEHVEGCKITPTRERLLELLPKDAVVAEIGVAFGDFTSEILSLSRPSKLHLIDSWGTERYQQGLLQIKEKFKIEIAYGIVEINQGWSTKVLEGFPDSYFDWVYIDTDHSYKTTKNELLLAETKVKPGGRICGHDFTSGNVVAPVPYGVIEACNEFCVRQNWRYEYLTLEPHGHFSFCLVKI
jgi:hypothetical protein